MTIATCNMLLKKLLITYNLSYALFVAADGIHRPMIQAIHELVRCGVLAGYIKARHQFLETKPWRCPKVIPKLY